MDAVSTFQAAEAVVDEAVVSEQASGQVVGLMMLSPVHKHMFIPDLEWLVVPPVLTKQFRVKLTPTEWRCGDQAWIMDVIAPFGGAEQMLRDVKSQVFSDKSLKYLRAVASGGVDVVEVS